MDWVARLLIIAIAYLLGSVSFAYLVARWAARRGHQDSR